MPAGGALIGAGANILGGILGNVLGAGDRSNAQKAAQQAYSEALAKVGNPELAKQLVLQQYQSAGQLTPEIEQSINLGPSNVAGIKEDAQLRNSQLSALNSLKNQGATGLSATDRAALNHIRQQNAVDTQAKTQQILQNFAARGQGGTGNELLAALQTAQAGNQNASQQSDDLAAQAQQRALQAIASAGQLGGQVRSQDFGVNQAKASAADLVNQFNTQNAVNRQTRNVGTKNQAQAMNLANSQNIANANVGQTNQEAQNARNIRLQQAQDQANLLLGKGASQAGYLNQNAANTQSMFKGLGNAIGQGSTAIAGYNPAAPASGGSSGTPDDVNSLGQKLKSSI